MSFCGLWVPAIGVTTYMHFRAACPLGKRPQARGLSLAGVEELDGVGRADGLADLVVAVQERDGLGPGHAPQPDRGWVLAGPPLGELVQACCALLGLDRGADGPEVTSDDVSVLAGRTAEAAAQQVDHAGRHLGHLPRGGDRVWQALRAVSDGHAHVGHATVPDLGAYVQPLLGTFRAVTGPDPQDVSLATDPHTADHVEGIVGDLAVTDLDDDSVDEDHRVDPVQRTGLPLVRLRGHLVGDLAEGLVARLWRRRPW